MGLFSFMRLASSKCFLWSSGPSCRGSQLCSLVTENPSVTEIKEKHVHLSNLQSKYIPGCMAVLWEECIRVFQQPCSFQFYLLRFIVQPSQAGCSFLVAWHVVCFKATLHCLSALANVASKTHWDVTKFVAFCQVFLQKTSISMPVLAAFQC